MTIDEKIQQALNAPDDCGYARLAKDLARFLHESRAAATTSRGRLEWLEGTVCWFLVLPGETDYKRAYYGATLSGVADAYVDGRGPPSRLVNCGSLDAAVRQIVAWATADGFDVPPHPGGLGR